MALGGALLPPKEDDLEVEIAPEVLGIEQLQVSFSGFHALPARQTPPLCKPVDVRVHGEGRVPAYGSLSTHGAHGTYGCRAEQKG
jgi:hypothetical protein